MHLDCRMWLSLTAAWTLALTRMTTCRSWRALRSDRLCGHRMLHRHGRRNDTMVVQPSTINQEQVHNWSCSSKPVDSMHSRDGVGVKFGENGAKVLLRACDLLHLHARRTTLPMLPAVVWD